MPTMKNDYQNVEILAPAGSYESLHAAINAGCDAVYFGVQGFNMRANTAKRFAIEDMGDVAKTCHDAGIKCYLALNTLVYDDGVENMKRAVDAVKEHGVDAIIAFDMSVLNYAKEIGVEVHISTQHSISNIEAVKYFAQWADRVVLARELTLEQIKFITSEIERRNICGPKGRLVEIEIFVHGAMCVAVSGRCGMSLYMYGTSANCGECSQPCRRKYDVTDPQTGKGLQIDNQFVMSPEDLCTIGMLDEIMNSGAVSLKIEGRGRSPEYVDEVVRCYREAFDSVVDGSYSKDKVGVWNERLGTVFNRGMSEGFYRGKAFSYWSHGPNSKATQKKELVGTVQKYYPKIKVVEVKIQASELDMGQQCFFSGEKTGVVRHVVESMLLDGVELELARKEQVITFVVNEVVRKGDKLYKLLPATEREY